MRLFPAPESALKPTLGVFDVVAITVSAVTPASSVFVIAPSPSSRPAPALSGPSPWPGCWR